LGGSYAENTENPFYQKITDRIERRKAGRTQKAGHLLSTTAFFLTSSSSRRREVTAERKKAAEEKRRLEEAKAQVRTHDYRLFVVFNIT
jgi:hypothetical protein